MDALRALCLCGKDDASDGNSSDGDGAVVTTESAAPPHPVVEVDCRDFDDGTRNFRLERRSVVWYCETLAREVADAAVDCACDEAARHRLEARMDMRGEMAAAGIEDLPTSFGASKRPRTARKKKKKQKAPQKPRKKHGWAVGDACECFYEGDGLWYVGLIASFAGDDGVEVALVGSECVVVVPHYWLQKTTRYVEPEPEPEKPPKQRLEDAPNPYAGLVDDKYWAQRFHYFSLYDCGVRLDAESWYSVTPEKVAASIARRVGGGRVVIDAFCGCGGNAIALASEGAWVVAVDVDARKLDMARHNAAIYGVADRIDFVAADAIGLLPTLKADAVFLSPPWGGPDYGDDFDVAAIRVGGVDGVGLLALALAAAPRVAYYLPRTTSATAIAAAAARAGAARGGIRVEAHYLNHRLKAKTAYVGWPADHAWPKNGKLN